MRKATACASLTEHQVQNVASADPAALARAIEQLWDDAALNARLAGAARLFAQTHCREQAAVDYLERYLTQTPA